MSRTPHALRVYFVHAGVSALAFSTFATLSSVYRFQTAGLDPLQLVLVGTVLELTVFAFEVPTGLVADLYGRRRSVVIGVALIGLGFVLEGALPSFLPILLAQVVWGLGATFESGAIDAWISDEIGVENANRAFLRAAQVGQGLALAGIAVATGLGAIYLGLPLLAGGAAFLALALYLLVAMPETDFRPEAEAAARPWSAARRTLAAGLELSRRRPVLLSIFAITVFVGASSETFDRLWEAHLLARVGLPSGLSPVAWFGLINAGALGLALVATEVVRRRFDPNGPALVPLLLALNLGLAMSVAGFGLAGRFPEALAFYWAAVLLRRVNAPLYRAWLNGYLEPRLRATVFSMNNQFDALGQIAGGPLLGVIANAASMEAAFVVSGGLLLPAALLYGRHLRRRRVADG